MAISSDNVKAALYLTGGVFVAYVVYSAYKTISKESKDILILAEKIGKLPGQIAKDAKESVAELGDIASGVNKTVRSTLGLPPPEYVPVTGETYGDVALPFSKWPKSAIATINAINKSKGETGYSGWTVYSNGTIVSPYKEYVQDLLNNNESDIAIKAQQIGRATSDRFLGSDVNTQNYDIFTMSWNDPTYKMSLVDQIPY